MASEGVDLYCVCKQPYDDKFMIECDHCKDWFHGSCVGIDEKMALGIELYYCPNCEKTHGPTTFKSRSINDRTEPTPKRHGKMGISKLVLQIKRKSFRSADEIVTRLRGRDVTTQFFEEHGFNKPIVVERKEGLDLRVPPSTFTVIDVEGKIGSDYMIDVIDVERQEDHQMDMRSWSDYFNSAAKREKTLNVISLEFSKTELSPLVEPPRIVKDVSWVSSLWPKDRFDEMVPERPEVQKYCLMGVKDSYTDFHIDFGGTSVWYHVLKGEKVFFFVEPTEENLRKFEAWESSSQQTQTFFGDVADRCWRLVVKQGQTVFIPTAWIHAVYTPIDSMVFGGNFLHTYNVPLQLEAYEIERRLQTNEKYQFPSYESVNWFAAKHVYDCLQASFEMNQQPAPYMLSAGEALARHLKKWTQRKDYSKKGDDPAQLEGISYGKLIKELNSILKKLNSGTKKGHRSSKRKGKKSGESKSPVNEEREVESLRLNLGVQKQEKAEEMEVEERKNVYDFEAEEDEEEAAAATAASTPANVLKVRIPRREVQTSPVKKVSPLKVYPSRVEEQKVSPIKLSRMMKEAEGSTNKRKRKHKKNKGSKRSRREPASHEEEEQEQEEEEAAMEEEKEVGAEDFGKFSLPRKETARCGLFGMGKKEEEEDSDKGDLVVDETPNAQHANRGRPSPIKPVTLKLKTSGEGEVVPQSTPEPESATPSEPPPPPPPPPPSEPADSIASILKEIVVDKNGFMIKPPLDRSRMIAAESMLSLHEQAVSSQASPSGPAPAAVPVADEERMMMEGCYQDNEFMYPSFEMEEEQMKRTSGKKQEKDDNWNPKARVNVLSKTEERVQRTGAKNQAIASGLAATARKLEENPELINKTMGRTPGGKVRESRVQPLGTLLGPSNVAVPGPSSSGHMPGPSTNSAAGASRALHRMVMDRTPDIVKPKNIKNRKGYKTAKQRLAKKMGIF